MWCVDGWYSGKDLADSMRRFYVDEAGATSACLVPNPEGTDSFSVLYFRDEPVASFHADDDRCLRSRQAKETP
jgi:hypothetical protein